MNIHPHPPSIRMVIRAHRKSHAYLGTLRQTPDIRERRAELSVMLAQLDNEHMRLTGNLDMRTPEAWREDR